jgi:hypothetical protein
VADSASFNVPLDKLLAAAERVGFPVVLLIILTFSLMPRLDHGLAIADRVDAELQVVISRCGYGP